MGVTTVFTFIVTHLEGVRWRRQSVLGGYDGLHFMKELSEVAVSYVKERSAIRELRVFVLLW